MLIKDKLKKIAFLDRDGIINSSKPRNGYIGHLKDFRWVPGAKKAIRFLKKKNFIVIVVSNQSGVARGYFKISNVYRIHKHIQIGLKKFSTSIDQFYFCPYHKDGIIKKYKKDSVLRKPKIGMFRLAQKRWPINKKKSFMIGDQKTDIMFAKRAKIKGYLFKGGNLFNFVKRSIKL